MNIRHNLFILFSLSCTLLFSGCVPSHMKTIEPIQQQAFSEMIQLMAPELQNIGILDAENAWYEPTFSFNLKDGGNTLFYHLDPSFRFPQLDKAYLPSSFAESAVNATDIEILPTSFKMKQGSDTLKAEIIAITDWNKDKEKDWIVVFTLETDRSQFANRTYYLLIDNLEARPITPQILALKDGFDNSFKVFLDTKPDFQPDSPNIEGDIGEFQVIEAPTIIVDPSQIEEKILSH